MNASAPKTAQVASQRVMQALDEAVNKLAEVERSRREPIAIVGMGCRFAQANTPEAFWQLLDNGVDAVTDVPSERWDIDAYYDADPDAPGKTYSRCGSFVDRVDQFDPAFFGVSPREALAMDPQQRLLLEVSWEALERAGWVPERQAGSKTGVFVGITTNDYARLLLGAGDPQQINAYYSPGNALNAVAGRLSYTLGLKGPSMAIDTACSSSLVSVHLACQSLRQKECDAALAGGVNLILAPENTIALSKSRMLSADGRCKTFDASADGIVRGEGCGVIVLKRLSDALAAKDPILGLIRGSAVNQDGPSSGFTVPNSAAQQALIRSALAAAKLSADAVDYVEAHGTGTSLGDPIEIRSLGLALGEGHSLDNPLYVGSVKTNLGHLESAAGIAGLIKLVLSLQHETIPQHLHFRQPNPHVDWAHLPVEVTATGRAWPRGKKPRIGGVSSFGASGTNAHILVEEAPLTESVAGSPKQPVQLLPLSAKSEPALKALATDYVDYLEANPDVSLAELCHTVQVGRGHFPHRVAITASSIAEAKAKLNGFSKDTSDLGIKTGYADVALFPQVAFLFTGQGSQYQDMGRELFDTCSVFRETLEECDRILALYLDTPLLEVLYGKATHLLDETAYTQPALFSLEYALATLWQHWGITPAALIGHSVGEFVAACVAGVFSLEDGLKLVAHRGRLMQALPPNGAMLAALASVKQIRPYLDKAASVVTLAGHNGPSSVVLSGETEAIDALEAELSQAEIKTKRLIVSHAFHSPLMEPMVAEFRKVAESITYSDPQLPLVSNLTGQVIDSEMTADYWCEHILKPVRFAEGMTALSNLNPAALVEIGPHPVLLGMGRTCVSSDRASQMSWLPSLRRGQPSDWAMMLEAVAGLYVCGVALDWQAISEGPQNRLILPTYPFQRERYWGEVSRTEQLPNIFSQPVKQNDSQHPLLGQQLRLAGTDEIRFETHLTQTSPVFLQDHQIYKMTIVPATAYLEMALAAGQKIMPTSHVSLSDISIQQALILAADQGKLVQIVLSPRENSVYEFKVFSLSESVETGETSWTCHASGILSSTTVVSLPEPAYIEDLKEHYPTPVTSDKHYQQFLSWGIGYGPYFQAVSDIWTDQGRALGHLQLSSGLTTQPYQLHPVLLDAAFQLLGSAFPGEEQTDAYLPVGIDRLQLYQTPSTSELWAQATILEAKGNNHQVLTADLLLFDTDGNPVAKVDGLAVRRISRRALQRILGQQDNRDWLYQVSWQPQTALPQTVSQDRKHWLILADSNGTAAALAEHLTMQGDQALLVFAGAEYEVIGPNQYQVNPLELRDFQQLIGDISRVVPTGCDGIIHLWSLSTSDSAAALSPEQLEQAQQLGCASTLYLLQALVPAEWSQIQRFWLVTQGACAVGTQHPLQVEQSALWGLGRTLALEHPELNVTRLDLDPSQSDAVNTLATEIAHTDREDQIAYRQGTRYLARLARYQADADSDHQRQSAVTLKISEYGILENLTWAPANRTAIGEGEVEIQVRATGLNFRDVLNALGMLRDYTAAEFGVESSQDLPFGGECAGIVTAVGAGVTNVQVGDEVIAAQAIGSFGSFVLVPEAFVALKPQDLSFEAAATLPIAFLTAYYGLQHLVKIQPGEKILVHSAAGGVGQAAVQIAQQAGAEIFATASPGKWDFLKSMGIKHIFNSRTVDFAEEIQTVTNGQGVDVILNSLSGEFIPKSFDVLSKGGRFIEIGKIGIWDTEQVEATRPDIQYFPFDLLDIAMRDPGMITTLLEELMQVFQTGDLQPLPLKVFSHDDVVPAFRYMAQAKHIGKVVVTLPEQKADTATADESASPSAELIIRNDASYLITGGLGALGLQVAEWLVEQGARHLVLTSRRASSAEVQTTIQQLQQRGAQVVIAQGDISQRADVERILQSVRAVGPPLRGVIHAAGRLDDGMLLQQQWERFNTVMAAKVQGTYHLHTLTTDDSLDYFVCFSAAAALLGSPGQGNYAAANAFMDALMHHRQAMGLPGLSVNWGPWAEGGMAAALKSRDRARWSALGVGTISSQAGLGLLQTLLSQSSAQVGVLPINWQKFVGQFPADRLSPFLDVFASTVTPKRAEFREKLEATPEDQQPDLLTHHIRSQIANVLGLSSPEQIELRQRLFDLGIDSLMAVELKTRLESSLGCTLRATLVFDYPTVEALIEYLATDVLSLAAASSPSEPVEVSDEPLSEYEDLSDDEAELLLLQELEKMNR